MVVVVPAAHLATGAIAAILTGRSVRWPKPATRYQPCEPGSPLNGPTTSGVIQPA